MAMNGCGWVWHLPGLGPYGYEFAKRAERKGFKERWEMNVYAIHEISMIRPFLKIVANCGRI